MLRTWSNTMNTLLALQNAVEHARNADYFGTSTTSKGGYPLINFFEKDGNYVAVAELPGIDKNNIKIEVKDNFLRLAGERSIDYGKDISRHRIEREPYRFDRTVKLPFQVDRDQIKAEYNNGLLAISLPRAEADKPKQITIN
ncbi:MAG: Hsp20/alpha crystallin family protein [SAR324 cluster bacterium]|nr:Hsp20/alpha crystallin family protein [SAR324 cluster bacterium]